MNLIRHAQRETLGINSGAEFSQVIIRLLIIQCLFHYKSSQDINDYIIF